MNTTTLMLSKEHLLCARLCSIAFMYRPFQFSQLPSGVGDDPIFEMRTLRYTSLVSGRAEIETKPI